ncbi:MAG: hypothetical protein N3A66_00500 [Planctomycetota bacterium]|nr:hypothetical protein [Planctomycetota bacterium]
MPRCDWRVGVAVLALTLAGCRPQKESIGMNPFLHQGYPAIAIAAGECRAVIYLPDAQKGFYRGPRFDWSGLVAQMEYRGRTCFSELKAPHDPLVHDHAVGTCEEFGMEGALGYDEAKDGETFIKIGIGRLEKPPGDNRYSFSRPYRLVEAFPWRIEAQADRVSFQQQAQGERGWGYAYTKTLILDAEAPRLTICHTLKNTGSNVIRTQHYSHNMICLDQQPFGEDYTLRFPVAVSTRQRENLEKCGAVAQGQEIAFSQRLAGSLWFQLDADWSKCENWVEIVQRRTGTKLKISGDWPIAKFCVYAEASAVCPEPFLDINLAPGEEISWRIVYLLTAS